MQTVDLPVDLLLSIGQSVPHRRGHGIVALPSTVSRRNPGLDNIDGHVKRMPQRTVLVLGPLLGRSSQCIKGGARFMFMHIQLNSLLIDTTCHRFSQYDAAYSASRGRPCLLFHMVSRPKLHREVSLGQDSWPCIWVDHIGCVIHSLGLAAMKADWRRRQQGTSFRYLTIIAGVTWMASSKPMALSPRSTGSSV